MKQTYDLEDIEKVLSGVLEDMELKQVIKLFKNYKKDENIETIKEESKLIDNWYVIGGYEFHILIRELEVKGIDINISGGSNNIAYTFRDFNNNRINFNHRSVHYQKGTKISINDFKDNYLPVILKKYDDYKNKQKIEEELPF
jgi:hypothetical protein